MQVEPFEKRNTDPSSRLSITSLMFDKRIGSSTVILSFLRFKSGHRPVSDFRFRNSEQTHPLRKMWERPLCYTKISKNDNVTKW